MKCPVFHAPFFACCRVVFLIAADVAFHASIWLFLLKPSIYIYICIEDGCTRRVPFLKLAQTSQVQTLYKIDPTDDQGQADIAIASGESHLDYQMESNSYNASLVERVRVRRYALIWYI
jgi:hypothetical protein